MVKHIQRIPKDEPKKDERDLGLEEWKFVAGIEPRPENIDPMTAKERTIVFSNKLNKATKEEIVKEKSDELRDEISNTDQNFRFANGIIKEKLDRLNKIKENEKQFSTELGFLRNKAKSKSELDNLNPKYLTEEDANTLIMHLEEEFERMKDKLLYQELIVQKTKDEIAERRRQIQQIKEKLRNFQRLSRTVKITDPIVILRAELKKAGIDEKNKIFRILDEISENLELQKLRDQLRKD